MRISLINGTTIYPLAGQAGVAESVHGSASGVRIDGDISKQPIKRVRADNALTLDRRNLATGIGFGTVRTFATCLLAEKFAADYDETFPRSGVLVLEGTGGTGYPDDIIVAGDLTTNGSAPAVFPPLDYAGTVNGRPAYEDPLAGGCSVQWTGSAWLLSHTGDVPLFTSTQNVATADLVTAWTPVGAATGSPALFGSYPDNRYLLDAVLDPPAREVIGCSVILRYTATGGRLAPGLPGTWSSDIPWPVGGNWEDS